MNSPLRLNIRRFRGSDLPELYKLLSDPDVMRFLEPPFSPEQTKSFLESAGLSDPPLIYAAENAGGSFIGYVIFHDYDAGSKEIGWVLKKDAWGKGCAKELTKQLIEKAASQGKSVIIECVPEQSVTKHIAEMFGFAYTGRADGLDIYKLENIPETGKRDA